MWKDDKMDGNGFKIDSEGNKELVTFKDGVLI
jgi:hypothetical protein